LDTSSDYCQELMNSVAFQCPLKCIETSIRAVIDSTTERKFKSINQRNENVRDAPDTDTMQLRDFGDQANYPGSSNELRNQLDAAYESDERRAELENLINQGNDFPEDLIQLGLDPQQFNFDDLANLEMNPDNSVMRYNMKDYETTQGTFHMRYLNSYTEINTLVMQASKHKNDLVSSLEKPEDSSAFTFSKLMKKFRGTEVTKKDKVEVFINLLHLQRESKVSLTQKDPEHFSDILVAACS